MTRARLVLDTRTKSKYSKEGLFPITVRIFHKKPRMIRLPYSTSKSGWDDKNMILKKSAVANKDIDCDKINTLIYNKLHSAKSTIYSLGDTINIISVDTLVENIKKCWEEQLDSKVKKDLSNEITLDSWAQILIDRKLKANKPATAK